VIEKMRWANLKDEAIGLLLELISIDLWFHVATCKNLNDIYTTFEGLFGKQDEM
jgi:hypothetical protein